MDILIMENYQIAKNVILVVYCAHKQNKIVYNAIILIDIMILLHVRNIYYNIDYKFIYVI